MNRLYLIAIRMIFVSYVHRIYIQYFNTTFIKQVANSPRIAWSSNKTFIAICL